MAWVLSCLIARTSPCLSFPNQLRTNIKTSIPRMTSFRAAYTSLLVSLVISILLGASPSEAQIKYLSTAFPKVTAGRLGVCSFNIQWLGHLKRKSHQELAEVVKQCDAVAIQEMVAPPWDVRLPNGDVMSGDRESADFVDAMKEVGLDGVMLAPEDTGPNQHHTNSTASEWPVLFYKKSVLKPAPSLPSGYVSSPLAKHPVFSRVPYAFGLQTRSGDLDFVLISVHMFPQDSRLGDLYSKARRIAEFQLIASWIDTQVERHRSDERDFFVMGDMNLEDLEEYHGYFGDVSSDLDPAVRRVFSDTERARVLGPLRSLDYMSLNYQHDRAGSKVFATNVALDKPYDHIMYDEQGISSEVSSTLEIVDLAKHFSLQNFPTTRSFIEKYSDHNPIRMQISIDHDRD